MHGVGELTKSELETNNKDLFGIAGLTLSVCET